MSTFLSTLVIVCLLDPALLDPALLGGGEERILSIPQREGTLRSNQAVRACLFCVLTATLGQLLQEEGAHLTLGCSLQGLLLTEEKI